VKQEQGRVSHGERRANKSPSLDPTHTRPCLTLIQAALYRDFDTTTIVVVEPVPYSELVNSPKETGSTSSRLRVMDETMLDKHPNKLIAFADESRTLTSNQLRYTQRGEQGTETNGSSKETRWLLCTLPQDDLRTNAQPLDTRRRNHRESPATPIEGEGYTLTSSVLTTRRRISEFIL
jgi:hypothetical protein